MSLAVPSTITSLFGPVSGEASAAATAMPGGAGGVDFTSVLKSAVNQVSSMQSESSQSVGALLNGGSADMSKVMISVEKADVAFQLMMQVRNKIVSAYQDIEKMQF